MTLPTSVAVQHMETWVDDLESCSEDLYRIQTTTGRIIPAKFNGPQHCLTEIKAHIRSQGRLVREIILKLRRCGVTTREAINQFWLVTMNPNTHALMVTHEPEATDTVFAMHKRVLAHMPDKIRPSVLYDNRKVLDFNTKDRKGGLDSSIRVGTAGKENFGSSQLVNFAHFSEYAKWPTHCIEPLMTSLMPCIPKTPESEIIIESTANGIGNMFYEMYWAARHVYTMYLDSSGDIAWKYEVNDSNKGNIWSRIFIPWFVFEENKLPVSSWEQQTGQKFVLDETEEQIIRTHMAGVPPVIQRQKMAWRRLTIMNDFGGDVARFNQENPATDDEAFMSTGEVAFNVHTVTELLANAPEPLCKYDIDPRTGQFFASRTGALWVWEEPDKRMSYAIPADVAEGIVEGNDVESHDASVADVCEQLSGRQVAQWHGRIDPDQFGKILVFLARRYNDAWLIPESNNHGHTAITSVFAMKYNKVYWEKAVDGTNRPRKRPGFMSRPGKEGGVRAEAVNALIAAVREGRHGIVSTRTMREMLAFKKNAKGKYVAEKNRHDDCVTAAAIGKYCIPQLPLPAAVRERMLARQYDHVPPKELVGTNMGGHY